MKLFQETPSTSKAAMIDKVFEILKELSIDALSEAPDETAVLEIFPDVARSILECAGLDAPWAGDFIRGHPLKSGLGISVTGVDLPRVLQWCIDQDKPLRMMIVPTGHSGLDLRSRPVRTVRATCELVRGA